MTAKSFAEILDETTEQCRTMDAPLAQRLSAVADRVRELQPGFADIVDRMVERLDSNGVGLGAPDIGEPMPEFVLPDQDGRLVRLSDLTARGPVVVSFNRGHWCPYCQLNADALAQATPQIRALGAEIVVITPEVSTFARALRDVAKAPFLVLVDLDGGYALELNLLFWVGDEKRAAMKAGGFDIEPYQANTTWMLPIPATFIIGSDGRVKARYVDPDYRRRMPIEDLLAAVGG
jgi:peroxiredoxin